MTKGRGIAKHLTLREKTLANTDCSVANELVCPVKVMFQIFTELCCVSQDDLCLFSTSVSQLMLAVSRLGYIVRVCFPVCGNQIVHANFDSTNINSPEVPSLWVIKKTLLGGVYTVFSGLVMLPMR